VQQRQRFGALNFAAKKQWNLFITVIEKVICITSTPFSDLACH
jgi:hypothetical protein